MALDKQLEFITESDLQALIDNEIREDKSIDYKKSLPSNSYEDKKEFLADVSSFANASGGHLIIGIEEEAGVPVNICGLPGINCDEEILRLENIIRDNIEPRIPSVLIRCIPLSTDNNVIVIYIPKSWSQPHMVRFQKHWRFYSRNSAGKYPLDVLELRTSFLLSETIGERIRQFREGRLANITSGETPVVLPEGAKIVLHIVPMDFFQLGTKFEITCLEEQRGHLEPIFAGGWNHRYNFDGFLTYTEDFKTGFPTSYLQVFRNGSIEAVEASILNSEQSRKGNFYIPSKTFEKELIKALTRFLNIQRQLGIFPPIFIMLSLLGVLGHIMGVDSHIPLIKHHPIDKKNIILPEITLNNFDCDASLILKPAFDAIWNATGWPRSQYYNENGKRKI